MLKHALVLVSAVFFALSAAQLVMTLSANHNAAAAVAVAPSAPVPPSEPQAASADASSDESGDAQVVKGQGGHFWAEAEVDGHWIHCLIDTGASMVSLTPLDAQRLGVDLSTLSYDIPLNTANGQAHAARVRLDHVTVAGARVDNVDAIVAPQGLTTSLLGMSYLGRLSRFEATPNTLILRR
jgi:aspartyl protease family protein